MEFRIELENKLDSVETLPTLPTIIARLETAFADDASSAEDVAGIVGEDPVLASQVLRVSNSAFFAGANGEIMSVREAIARLGFAESRRICTTLTMIESTRGFGTDMDHQRFWQHCLVAAVTTGVLSEFGDCNDTINPEEAYMAGLLHDIGVLVLDQFFPEEYCAVHNLRDDRGIPCDVAERAVLGIDHGEIGGALLRHWNLPISIVEAVTWHHQPGAPDIKNLRLVQIVHLAEFVCTCLGIGDGGDGTTMGFSEIAWSDLGMSVDHIPKIIENVKAEVARSTILSSLGEANAETR